MADAKRVVAAVVGRDYEWWKSSGEDALRCAATVLLIRGLTEDQAADVLGAVWAAAASEYGD